MLEINSVICSRSDPFPAVLVPRGMRAVDAYIYPMLLPLARPCDNEIHHRVASRGEVGVRMR